MMKTAKPVNGSNLHAAAIPAATNARPSAAR